MSIVSDPKRVFISFQAELDLGIIDSLLQKAESEVVAADKAIEALTVELEQAKKKKQQWLLVKEHLNKKNIPSRINDEELNRIINGKSSRTEKYLDCLAQIGYAATTVEIGNKFAILYESEWEDTDVFRSGISATLGQKAGPEGVKDPRKLLCKYKDHLGRLRWGFAKWFNSDGTIIDEYKP